MPQDNYSHNNQHPQNSTRAVLHHEKSYSSLLKYTNLIISAEMEKCKWEEIKW
jgi:hypothetical protein